MNYRLWTAALLVAALIGGCRPSLNPAELETTPPSGQAEAVTPEPGTLNLASTILAQSDLGTFGSALIAADIAPELEAETPYTLLAPTDAAFEALPEGMVDRLFADPAALADVMRYHLIAGATTAADLAQVGTALSLQGEPLTVTLSSDVAVTVNGANVVEADIAASNGMIHKLDQVLIPTTAQALAAPAPTATPVASSPLTTTGALLPTPTSAPAVITATDVTTTTDIVTTTQVMTTTEVLTSSVPATGTDAITQAAAVTDLVTITTTSQPTLTIAAVLAARTDLTSTATAIATAGLAEALAEPGPFTFFAPTNAAFARMDPAELDTLLNENVRLARTMQYHVIADRATVDDLARLGVALSTLGQSVDITLGDDGTLFANGMPVIESIETANGIVHVLDGLLIPAEP
jgi:uncharacterized surface protein with fasciclin (FAS1) repeats